MKISRTIMVSNNIAYIDTPIYLYKGDGNVLISLDIINITISTKLNQTSTTSYINDNISYATACLCKRDSSSTVHIVGTKVNDKIELELKKDMMDETVEVGEYRMQVHLFDKENNRLTIPVVEEINIMLPLCSDGYVPPIVYSSKIGEATVDYSKVVAESISTSSDFYHTYNWTTGEYITANKLNNMITGIDEALYDIKNIQNNYATKNELSNKANKNEIPTKVSQLLNDEGYLTEHQDLSHLATESYVKNEIANAQLGGGDTEIDLSGYATKDELNNKADKSSIPTKVSQLENDSKFLTSVPSEYITETELNNKDFATKSYVSSEIAKAQLEGEDVDLDLYALKEDIPTKLSELQNDKNFLTSIPSEYATIQYVDKEIAKIEISGGGSTAINYDLNVKAINHRGYSVGAPENTIPAYIMSKQMGFTYVETDVSFTSDNVAVLLHDATIDRTSNGSGDISTMTYEKALMYDFGSWFSSEYAGTKIATFKEFITLCKRLGLHPYIELKSAGGYTEEQIVQIVQEVKENGMEGKVTYISFEINYLTYVKNADPHARLGYLVKTYISSIFSKVTGLRTGTNETFLDIKASLVNNTVISKCISNDIPLEVWVINDETEMVNMNGYISGVTSDNLVAGKILYENSLVYTPPISTYVPTTSISLDKTLLTFDDSTPQTLTATVEPSNSSDVLIWKSSDTSVATVKNGVVTPITKGDCTITATSGDFSATCNVVVNYEPLKQYSITKALTGCVGSQNVNAITEGESYTEVFTTSGKWTLEGATVQITMGGVDISSKYDNGVLSIEEVTGDIVISIEAQSTAKTFNITKTLTGCNGSNNAVKVLEGDPYIETFTAITDYTLEGATVQITMGGLDISSKYSSNTLTIEEVTGDIVISIEAVYTLIELIPPVVDYAFTINGTIGTLTNIGTGGSVYDTTTDAAYTAYETDDGVGIQLYENCYALCNYPVSANTEFTLHIKGGIKESSNATYERIFRCDTDAVSAFWAKAKGRMGLKVTNVDTATNPISNIKDPILESSSKGVYATSAIKKISIHDYVFVGTSTDIHLYIDGVKVASQSRNGMLDIQNFGIGNTDPSTTYGSKRVDIKKWRIYNYAMTDAEVAEAILR